MFEPPEVLTIAEAAKELRCSKAHLAKVLNGQVPGVPDLPHLCLGRRKLIRRRFSSWSPAASRRALRVAPY